MNIKINTICFILLFFILISAVNAADSDNETFKPICQPDPNQDIDNVDEEKLQMNLNQDEAVSKSIENNAVVASSKSKVLSSLIPEKLKVTLKAPDVKMHYKDGSKFKVTLKDENKKAMKNTKVKIAINGVTYTKKTDSKGTASISLNLKSGTYKVVTTYDGSIFYAKKSVNSKVTIKSTIKCSDLTKYYKNTASYYSTFYDKKGKLLKSTAVKFKLNSKTYSVKTNKKGVAKLAVDLKPGKYSISSVNSKTSETITKSITIKTLIESSDLTMNDDDGSRFTVKILNSNGKASPNKKVILKTNGNTYTITTNKDGQASILIDFEPGQYSVTTEYDGLKNTNKITVKKIVKLSSFSHITSIPNYVNVTTPYVFHNSAYALKTGTDGIIRMSKNEVFTVQISETKGYLFSQSQIPGVDTTVIGYKTHLVPFDGSGVKSDYNKANLKGEGILISSGVNYTQIEYRSTTQGETELFGVYMDKGLENSETITYIQNNKIKAMVNFYTYNYDELGLQYNLAKFYGKSLYDFNYKSYEEMTNNNTGSIRFANTGEPVTFSYFGKSIVGYLSREDITTRLFVNGIEELEKPESISYGLDEKYRSTLGFEVLQGYAIINQKVTKDILESWISKSSSYLNKFGIMNVYGMFLADLETAWLADEIANQYAKDLNVNWKRSNTLTILGGINLNDTYLHILNADMGMKVIGSDENCKLFRLMNSINLPNIESYVLTPVAERYWDNTTNSLENVLDSVENNNYTIAQMDEMFYIFSENDGNSIIVLNSTTGVASVILSNGNFAYKGSSIPTTRDCCGVGIMPQDIIKGIRNTVDKISKSAANILNNIMNKIHPLSILGYMAGNLGAGIAGKIGSSSAALGFASTVGLMIGIHSTANYVKNNFVNEKDWHYAYEHVTLTRDGYMQNKKFFNIPRDDGTYDYVVVKINEDMSLNRNDAYFYSHNTSKKLTKQETYKYFTEEKWTACNVPRKYQKYEVPLIFG